LSARSLWAILIDRSRRANPKYKTVFDQLAQAKVAVVASSPAFNLTHSKMFIVDGQWAFISTMNLVGHFEEMRDFGLFTQDIDIIKELMLVFTADLDNAKNKTMNTPALANANLIWSPVNAQQKLADLIDSARSNINLMVENLGSQTMVLEALKRARSRQVVVRLLVPECDLNPNPYYNFQALREMAAVGAEGHVAPYPSSSQIPYIHAKVIVVDHHLAFLGSENFSFTSLTKSRETGVVFSNQTAIQQLEAYFDKDWKSSKPLPATNPNSCPPPSHFSEF
jgi:phosphatidylserine/phosphatidylglycerophosphate/cardiolipin synthase-like enzyme